MNYIGFQHNYSPGANLRRRFSPSLLNRVVLMERSLRPTGYRLFLYSPREVRPGQPTVPGSVLEGGKFVPVRAPVPSVNGNWTHRTRRLLDKGIGYREFGRWALENRIGIYVPHAFSELLVDKLKTYKLVRGFHETLHPHCEIYAHTIDQLEYFVEAGRLTFVKPRRGSKGNRIITLRRDHAGLVVTRYHGGQHREARARGVAEAMRLIEEATMGKRKYVIQHGVDTMRHGNSTFDVRVTMLHDGTSWRWLHEARLSVAGSDVSNVSQGGEITSTENLLPEIVGLEAAQELLHGIRSEAFGLAAYLERLHPGEIPEVAFDFAIDREGNLRLLEVNTKPGLAGVGSDVSVYDKSRRDEPLFERWVYPHTDCLARFLLGKSRRGIEVDRSA